MLKAAYIHIQKPGDLPYCLLGVVPQPTDSRLSETKIRMVIWIDCACIPLQTLHRWKRGSGHAKIQANCIWDCSGEL